jgi:phytoene desaturase (3,4-didehydrolycopene-forming)
VLEKNDFSGGRCSLIHWDGYRFDQGPSLLLLPMIFKEMFGDLGTTMEAEGIEMLRCNPNYNIWFSDGERFQQSSDMPAMKRQIEKYEGKEGMDAFFGFMQEGHRHFELSMQHVLAKNFTKFIHLARLQFLMKVFQMHPHQSIWYRVAKYFKSDRLRRVFTFATMYMGMSPYDAPSTYSLLMYSEMAEGIWYPRGGFNVVLQKLQAIGERMGVRYRLNAPVSEILTSPDGSANGVRLADGTALSADLVVCNADLVYAYSNLLPQTDKVASYAKTLRAKDGSCGSISFYWALSRKVPELGTHNIFMSDHYKSSFDRIFKDQNLPDEPSFYVNVPSRIDPTAAPEGCDAVIALVPCGHLLHSLGYEDEALPLEKQDWDALIAKARRTVLDTVAQRIGCERLDNYIIHEEVNDPNTWQAKFNLDKGSILGLAHNFFNVLSFRPGTKSSLLKNTYFVGASTHPGTGVPVVLAGSRITAEQILKDQKVPIPWEGRPRETVATGIRQDKDTHPLDKVARNVVSFSTLLALLIGLVLFVLLQNVKVCLDDGRSGLRITSGSCQA